MNKSPSGSSTPFAVAGLAGPPLATAQKAGWVALAVVLAAGADTLVQLFRFALSSSLYSHIVLVPFVSAYLVWQQRGRAPAGGAGNGLPAAAGFASGLAVLAAYAAFADRAAPVEDLLAWKVAGLLLVLLGAVALALSRAALRRHAFALGFLVFLLPMPVAVSDAVERLLQHASAAAAAVFFQLAGMTLFRDGTLFRLPGYSLNVAPECSGIHSTLALFITSIVAGCLCLRSPAHRVLLAAVVLPLAVARNGFRVFVIGELCVRVGPHMIDSYIHHHGGPIFFALALVPFAALLLGLMRRESRRPRA